jgi:glycosyltransferase involved in cell wall biosynthesis
MLGELTLSMLQGERGVLGREFLKLLDWIRAEPLPDVINLPNSLLIALAQPLRRETGRPVCCTLQGEELFIDGLVEPYRQQTLELIRRQVGDVDRFVAVSDYCARFMSEFLAIPAEKISVVPLGVNLKGYGPPRIPEPSVFRVGYFARLTPEKGLHLLAEAYVRFRRRIGSSPVRLDAAGYSSPAHAAYLQDVKKILNRAGLDGEFTYHGVVDREGKLAFLRSLDVLSVPATYDEPKGLFLIEAMACGVPVVQPRRGAFIEIVERTSGGLLVEPDDPEALADGLYQLWKDRAQAAALGRQAYDAVRRHYDVGVSAEKQLQVYAAC